MANKTAIFTFTFFALLLLYTISAARPVVDLPVTNPTAVKAADNAFGGSKILLPGKKIISDETTGHNLHPEPRKIAKNDLTPRTNFSRFHPINRHFQSRPHRGPKQAGTRRPCIKHSQYMIPATKISGKKDQVAPERTNNSRFKTFRGEAPENLLKVKHHYGSHGQDNNHNHKNNNINHRDKNKENVFDREKMKRLSRQQNQKKSDYKDGLMKNIRKFLKHTFD